MRPWVVAWVRGWLGWPGWLVPTYVVMLGLGCLLAAVRLVGAARQQGYTRQQTLGVVMIGYAMGLAGACLVPVVQGAEGLLVTGRFRPPSGMAAYGGLLAGVAGAVVWMRRARLAVLPMLDAAAPSFGLAYFFARLGCFLAGCDYGQPTAVAWGVRFPPGSHAFRDHVARGWIAPDAPASLPVHPTQLYLAFSGLVLFLLCESRPATGDGRRFLTYVIGYAVLRSLIEGWRGDEGRGFVGPLSTSQALALVSVALAVGMVRWARRAPA